MFTSEELAKSLGPNAFPAGKVDVTSEELVKNAIEKTVQKFGKIAGVVSILFNTAQSYYFSGKNQDEQKIDKFIHFLL